MFDDLRELSQYFIHLRNQAYRRYFINTTPMKHRFSIILGERGIGKTTTLIQCLLDASDQDPLSEEILYIQADHFLMGKTSLYEIAETFHRLGGKVIAFDEIHKYPNWSKELKSIFDTFVDLRIFASGSSALEIHKGTHDLARRAIVYEMYGLSLREFIELKYGCNLPTFTLDELVIKHTQLALDVIRELSLRNLKILKLFREYLEFGYYPYFLTFSSPEEFKITVEQNLHTTIESDLVAIYPQLTGNSLRKIKQLVVYLAQAVPFTPNWQDIKRITDIGDDRTIKTYFKYLEDARILMTLKSASKKMSKLESGEKIFLANPNQLFAFATHHPNEGTLRETFFLSSVKEKHTIETVIDGDFLLDGKYVFEVGGKNKKLKQIKGQDNGYLALDHLEGGSDRRIPLWLFGFLY